MADVQYTPGGPDFTHDFLFVTDVTSQKIIASDQDEWVAEYGTEGSGLGQFWGPHGICNLACYYFVADMFNNRVITYRYEKGWDDPMWSFTLTAGLNWPIDVEVKKSDPSANPPEADYIVVADHRNHRLALWEWATGYYPSFDQYYGEYGSAPGQFIYPTSVCFGRDPETGWQTNDLFVTDYGNDRLVWLYLAPGGIAEGRIHQFPTDAELTSVEVDNKGLVYVVDRHNAKIYKFATSESHNFELLGVWGEKGTADGQLYNPNMLTVAHGRYCPYPNPCVPMTSLGDVFVSESWGDQTGVRRFVIAADAVNLSATYVPYNEDTGEGNFIWYTYHLTDFANVTEQVFRGAELCTTYNRGSLNWGSQGNDWNVGSHPHGETYTVKITASSIYDPTIVVGKTVDVYVDTMTTHNPIITRGIRCKYIDDPFPSCNDCWQCIKEGYSYTIDVQAFDPDDDPLEYEWSCRYGWLNYHYKRITTSENYVCYTAPVWGEKSLESFVRPDFIIVTVNDPYGGDAYACVSITPHNESTSCLCGDVNDDGAVSVGDVVYLACYLYVEDYPPPHDPIERADANNDCVVNSADITYLINYLFGGGPLPVCCWIHFP